MVPCAKAPALVRTLLIGGANPDHQDVWGVVPLSMAAMAMMVEAVDALMEVGADPTIRDADSMTPRELYTGPAVSAVINKWLRRRTGESAPLEDGRACAACKKTGDDGVITRQCSACHTVYYCSRNCQRGHLKEHKPHCKPFSMDNTVILRPNYDSGNTSHVPLASFNPVLSQLGVYMPELRPSAHRARYAHPPKTFPKDYVIKVQLPVTAGQPTLPMLVYSKSRNFECRIRREDAPAAYDRVAQIVRKKGFQGAKAYFVAQLKSENELIVKVSEVLADQPF
ncbi:hypothetical protein PENSPDRAFT_691340 [Peniophora sp. CONT]|nr:hypothetical protein PENSPDRAFT_691340 [Peniophora sp. CONT]